MQECAARFYVLKARDAILFRPYHMVTLFHLRVTYGPKRLKVPENHRESRNWEPRSLRRCHPSSFVMICNFTTPDPAAPRSVVVVSANPILPQKFESRATLP